MNSLLFGMTFKDHMFVIVPKMLKNKPDWRLAVFQCGSHMMAFDGAALLLWELWQRSRADEEDGGIGVAGAWDGEEDQPQCGVGNAECGIVESWRWGATCEFGG